MGRGFTVTGTDTGIGKTVFAAALAQALNAHYWKPVQAGLEEESDTQKVARLSGQPVLPEAYCLSMPASPHLAAEAEGFSLNRERLALPVLDKPLIVEGAGGALVPLTRSWLYADQFADWGLPVIICARTALGTINHTLLTIEALRARACPLLGVAFIGKAEPAVEATIVDMGKIVRLGRLPFLDRVTRTDLKTAFTAGFDLTHFQTGGVDERA